MKIKILALLTVFAIICGLAGCSGNDRVIRVGVTASRLPLAAEGRNGPEGFEIELCRLMAEEMGREVQFRLVTAEEGLAQLAAGKLDLVTGLGNNVTGGDTVALIGPYMQERLVTVLPAADTTTSLAYLAGKRVALRRNDTAAAWLSANPAVKNSFSSTVFVEDLYSAMLDIMVSDYDAALMTETEARWRITQNSMKLRIGPALNGEGDPRYFAVTPDSTLAGHVGTALYELSLSGELTELSVRWFGADILPDAATLQKNFGIILTEDPPAAGEDAESSVHSSGLSAAE
ncbi:MAG: transporter substrate-binding domain-containing protein [Clostridia bacterium]|nr:transporter substrate-binding domain-containing protein [Clostridia bacterium]